TYGSLKINPAKVSITGTDNTATYTGNQQTNTGATVTGAVNGETVTVTGSYAKATTVNDGKVSDASYTLSSNNYTIDSVTYGSLKITPVTVTLSATKIYDGSAAFTVTSATSYTNYSANFTYTLSGTDAGNVYLTGGTGSVTSANVGNYTSFASNNLTLSSANYALSSTISATINPAPLGVALYGTYNGSKSFSAGANLTANTTSSAIASDSLTGNFIKVVGLQGSDAVSGATINNQNVAGNGTNSVTALTGIGGFASSSTDRSAGNYYVASSNYNATGGTFSSINTVITPIAGTTNTVTLSKATLGINLNATYNGTNTYTSTIKTNGLVGTADTTNGVASVTI
ncbi:hypothetical protein G6705_09000, partial [Polynucleobacter paneuropaeus]|nr:hypothetical protein [Polynucleobacter paneuropaeus]